MVEVILRLTKRDQRVLRELPPKPVTGRFDVWVCVQNVSALGGDISLDLYPLQAGVTGFRRVDHSCRSSCDRGHVGTGFVRWWGRSRARWLCRFVPSGHSVIPSQWAEIWRLEWVPSTTAKLTHSHPVSTVSGPSIWLLSFERRTHKIFLEWKVKNRFEWYTHEWTAENSKDNRIKHQTRIVTARKSKFALDPQPATQRDFHGRRRSSPPLGC